MIKLNDVTKEFYNDKGVFDLTFHLEKGRLYGLVGPNGSGKTTIIKLLVQQIKPNKGYIEISNVHSKNDIIDVITYLPDSLDYGSKSLNSLSKFYSDIQSNFDLNKCHKIINTFKLSLDNSYSELSKGQKMLFRVALAVARDTSIYIFDEPLSGIDAVFRKTIIDEILTELNSTDKIIIISSHELHDLNNVLDSVIIVDEGKVEGVFDIDELKCNQSLYDWYLERFPYIQKSQVSTDE